MSPQHQNSQGGEGFGGGGCGVGRGEKTAQQQLLDTHAGHELEDARHVKATKKGKNHVSVFLNDLKESKM